MGACLACANQGLCNLVFRFLEQSCKPHGCFHLEVALNYVCNEAAEIPVAIAAKLLHGVYTKHSITLELRLREELIARALMGERRVCLEVFIDVASFVALTPRL